MNEGLFISYRRSDSSGSTGRLADNLRQNGFPDHRDLFLDIDQDIPPGTDFRKVIDQTLAECDIVVVVIGPHWADATDDEGLRRLDRTSDTHRLEVAAALNADALVVPVLVEGATHPSEQDLPDELKDLAYLQSWNLGERTFPEDVKNLVRTVAAGRARIAAEEARRTRIAADNVDGLLRILEFALKWFLPGLVIFGTLLGVATVPTGPDSNLWVPLLLSLLVSSYLLVALFFWGGWAVGKYRRRRQ